VPPVTRTRHPSAPLRQAVTPQPRPVDATAATSWTQHKIVFKSSPLPRVFEELNRYSKRPFRIQGGGLDDFRISGTYATTDPALLIRFLREQPGIVVEETTTAIIVSKAQ
jgi:ferric-dicitrate binding protein FerR (iron transport regulator)